ncbi:MAG: hypothetical protein E7085_02760 [Parabacteroides distasonis]|nr:hypothetical protein [Parabacteroides distasonis]
MRKEFGKWLMDVAKYLATAVLLSSVFEEIQNTYRVYVICSFVLIVLLCLGLILVGDSQKEVIKKNKNRRK